MSVVTKFRSERSTDGYTLDVLKSALQKYIRRCRPESAVYVADQLNGFKGVAERVRTNFFHRLMIIYLEDISIANLELFFTVDDVVMGVIADRGADEDVISLVSAMAKSKKTRALSHIRSLLSEDNLIANFNLDLDVEEGDVRKLFKEAMADKRWESLFYLSKMEDKLEALKPYTDERIYTTCKRWYRELKNLKEREFVPLFLLASHIVECQSETLPLEPVAVTKVELKEDYIFDIHTKCGNRSLTKFAFVGAHVEQEVYFSEFLKEAKYHYNALKVKKEYGKFYREEASWNFVCRAQLVCGAGKYDTYFARWGDELKFIKGPMKREHVESAVKAREFKKRNNIPYIDFKVVKRIPNMWEKTPLSYRNSLCMWEPAYFTVSPSVVEDLGEFEVRSSKLWPPTEVTKLDIHFNPVDCTESEIADFCISVFFRWLLGMPDLANRNFIKYNGRIVSIDEDYSGREVKLRTELKRTRVEMVTKWLKSNFPLPDWDVPEELQERYSKLSTLEGCLNLLK